MFEGLESRRLLNAAIDGSGNLVINGSPAADTILVSMVENNIRVQITPEGFDQMFLADDVNVIGVNCGAGNDVVVFAPSINKPSVILGEEGNDTITGGSGNDTILAGDGDDWIDGGLGADVMAGDAGIDTVSYATRTNNLHIYLDGIANDGEAGEGDNVDGSVDIIIGGQGNDRINAQNATAQVYLYGMAGDDTLVGGQASDRLNGGPGNDDLRGGPGNETMVGGAGRDIFNGGPGTDTVTYYYAGSAVTLIANGRSVSGTAREQDCIKDDIENLIGSDFDDHITGNAGANILRGLAGNDTLIGGAGADTLFGGPGNDFFSALDGEIDTLDGEDGTDSAEADPDDILINIP